MSTELLLGFKSQPEFPRQDLTEQNASMLELLLQNGELLFKSHKTAEKAVWLYTYSHPAVEQAGQRLAAVQPRLEAFTHGVVAYEAIAALVQATPVAKTDERLAVVRDGVANIGVRLSESALLSYVDDASEQFKAEMPHTVDVVRESAKRLQGDVAGYAIIGAGVARQFELSAA